MGRKLAGSGLVSLMMVVAACASAPSGTDSAEATRGDASLITRAELERAQWPDIYHLVLNLRPRWMHTRGPDSFQGRAEEVQVYVDGVRLGSVELLRNMPTSGIDHLEWIDPISAAGRWGLNHSHGVIAIAYSPDQVPPRP